MPAPSKIRKGLVKFLVKIDNLKPGDRKALVDIKKYQAILKGIGAEHTGAWDAYEKALGYCANAAKILTRSLEKGEIKLASAKVRDLEKQMAMVRGMKDKLEKIEHRIDQLVRKDFIQLKKEHPIKELQAINFE